MIFFRVQLGMRHCIIKLRSLLKLSIGTLQEAKESLLCSLVFFSTGKFQWIKALFEDRAWKGRLAY